MSTKAKAENLPENFKISDKQLLILIQNLFGLVKDNNQLINLLDKRIKLLEKKEV